MVVDIKTTEQNRTEQSDGATPPQTGEPPKQQHQTEPRPMSETTILVCPSCQKKNRIPTERLTEHPNCGSCKAPLFPAEPITLSEEALYRHIRGDELPLVVDFWAPWCGPCQMMAPSFAAAATALAPKARFAKIDTEQFPNLGGRFGIRGIPLMILFKGGKEVARQTGAMDAGAIERWVKGQI